MEGAKRHKIELLELNVQPDHLHIVASLPRGMTDIRALFLLKGYSSKLLFMLCCEFRLRLPNGCLWSKGNFSSTVGFTELSTVIEYVRTQDIHHAE
jgi:putative transposase